MRKRLRKALAEALPSVECTGVYSAFDLIGDIAIIKMPSDSSVDVGDVAEVIMKRHKNVKAVYAQKTAVQGDFRLRGLSHVAGEKRTCTVHRESGCSFKIDIERCYFSPRLSGERMRIANLVQPGETVVNMFAGVGCFSIVIAKHVSETKIYSIDVNPDAWQFMVENVRLNRVYGNVVPVLSDAKTAIESRLLGCADRVLMPLPEKALEYLPLAVSTLKPRGGWVHVHAFKRASCVQTAAANVKVKIAEALRCARVNFEFGEVREVRSVGPNWFQIVADTHVLSLSSHLVS